MTAVWTLAYGRNERSLTRIYVGVDESVSSGDLSPSGHPAGLDSPKGRPEARKWHPQGSRGAVEELLFK
jgi:hypothetical protein